MLKLAKELFSEHDADDSGGVGADELAMLLTALYARLRIRLEPMNLLRDCRISIAKFDSNRTNTLEFAEMMKMLLDEPWISQLPGAVMRAMPVAVNKELKKLSSTEMKPSMGMLESAEDPSRAVLQLCRTLFEEADANQSGERVRTRCAELHLYWHDCWNSIAVCRLRFLLSCTCTQHA